MKNVINVETDELITVVKGAVDNGISVRITVVGSSMYPFLRSGIDSVELYGVDEVKRNDVLFYVRDDGSCVLHRCIGICGDEYIMCGDNQTKREYGIRREQIMAAARKFYRGSRLITDKTPWYRIYKFLWCTLWGLRPAMCVMLRTIMKIKRTVKGRKTK